MKTVSELMKLGETIVIDVRTREEYMGGHVAGSTNIPVNEIPQHLDELRKMGPLVLCCASGGRSGQATQFLKQNGIEATNGGPWTNVNQYKNN